MLPIISIIVPVYNGEQFIDKCIRSILKQTISEIQIIVIDDGSTDNTLKILEGLQSRSKSMKVYHQSNKGVSSARNIGLKIATGDWIIFVDADDYIDPDYCEEMLHAAIESSADVLISNPMGNGKEKIHTIDNHNHDLLIQSCLSYDENTFPFNIDAPWGKIFRASIIRNNSIGFPENLKRSEDAYFCICFYENTYKINVLNYSGYHHIERKGSLCRSYMPDSPQILEDVLTENTVLVRQNHADDKGYMQACYFRVLPGIVECENNYFFHIENKNNNFFKLCAYQKLLNQPMIRKAINELSFSVIKFKQYRIRLLFYKLHLGWLFFLIKSK